MACKAGSINSIFASVPALLLTIGGLYKCVPQKAQMSLWHPFLMQWALGFFSWGASSSDEFLLVSCLPNPCAPSVLNCKLQVAGYKDTLQILPYYFFSTKHHVSAFGLMPDSFRDVRTPTSLAHHLFTVSELETVCPPISFLFVSRSALSPGLFSRYSGSKVQSNWLHFMHTDSSRAW